MHACFLALCAPSSHQVVAIEWVLYRKTVSQAKAAAIVLLMVGITVATVSDAQVRVCP
jgi:hypothetical protein